MGSFNYTCASTNFPIICGDRVVVLAGIRQARKDDFTPGFSFTPIALPIRGTYDDYGNIEADKNSAYYQFKELYGKTIDDAIRDEGEDYVGRLYYQRDNCKLDFLFIHEDIFDKMADLNNLPLSDCAISSIYIHKHVYSLLGILGFRIDENYEKRSYSVERFINDKGDVVYFHFDSLFNEENYYAYRETYDHDLNFKNFKDLCEFYCIEMPQWFNDTSFLEYSFKESIKLYNAIKDYPDYTNLELKVLSKSLDVKELENLTANEKYLASVDNDFFLFIRDFKSVAGKFCHSKVFTLSEYYDQMNILALYNDDTLLIEDNAKETAKLMAYIRTMCEHNLTWQGSHSAHQESRFKTYKKFFDIQREFFDKKYKEETEESED